MITNGELIEELNNISLADTRNNQIRYDLQDTIISRLKTAEKMAEAMKDMKLSCYEAGYFPDYYEQALEEWNNG